MEWVLIIVLALCVGGVVGSFFAILGRVSSQAERAADNIAKLEAPLKYIAREMVKDSEPGFKHMETAREVGTDLNP